MGLPQGKCLSLYHCKRVPLLQSVRQLDVGIVCWAHQQIEVQLPAVFAGVILITLAIFESGGLSETHKGMRG